MQDYCILLFCNVYTSDIWIEHPALEDIPCRWLLASGMSNGTRINAKSKKAEAVRQFSEKHNEFMIEIDLRNYNMEGPGKREVLKTLYGLKITMPIKVVFCLASDTSICEPFQIWLSEHHIPYRTLTKKEIQWLFSPNEKEPWGCLPAMQQTQASSTMPKSRKVRKKGRQKAVHSLKMENGSIIAGPSVKEMNSFSERNRSPAPEPKSQEPTYEDMGENGEVFDFVNQLNNKEMISLPTANSLPEPSAKKQDEKELISHASEKFSDKVCEEETLKTPEMLKDQKDVPETDEINSFGEQIQKKTSFQEKESASVPDTEEASPPMSKEIISSKTKQKPSHKNLFSNKLEQLLSSILNHPSSCTKEEEAERLEWEKQQEIKREQTRKAQAYLESLIKRGEGEFVRAKEVYLFYAWQSFKILIYINLTVGQDGIIFTDETFYFIWLSLLQAKREEDFEEKINGKPYAINKGSFKKLKRDASILYKTRTCFDAGRRFRPPERVRVIPLPTLEKGEAGVRERLMALRFSASELEQAKNMLLFWVAATMFTRLDAETGAVFTRQWMQKEGKLPKYTDYLKDDLNGAKYLSYLYQELLKSEDAGDYEISLRVGYQIKMSIPEETFSALKQTAEETARIQKVLTAALEEEEKKKDVPENEKKGKGKK